MRKLALIVAAILVCTTLCGQNMSDEYEREYGSEEEFRDIFSDTGLLLMPLGDGSSIFDRLSRYNFNIVSYRRRGLDGRTGGYYLGSLDISSSHRKYADYALYGALRIAAPFISEGRRDIGNHTGTGGIAGTTRYGLRPSQAREGMSLRVNYSEQRYRGAAKFSWAGGLGQGWHGMLNAYYRSGRDKFVGGVFSESYVVSAGVEKDMGQSGNLSVVYMRSASERGLRSWTVQEAYDLTDDNLYNPAWGWYGDKQRSSRLRKDADDLITVNYGKTSGSTDISASVMFRAGERSRSGLAWRDARNPMPDYYRNFPSYFSDPSLADMLARMWREERDSRQLDWEYLWSVNSTSEIGAAYIMDEKVERMLNIQAAVSAVTTVEKGFTVNYGIRGGVDKANYFRRVADLMGGEYTWDYDQYLTGMMGPNELFQNDLRNPDRKVEKGEKLGYDYDIPRRWATVFASGTLHCGKWLLGFGAGITFSSLLREGHTEKGNFPGERSFGKSDRFDFTTYGLSASAVYSFSPLHRLTASAYLGEGEPAYENIFLNPATNNASYGDPEATLTRSIEAGYSVSVSASVEVNITGYWTRTSREADIYRYYDDISSRYVAMPLRDIGKRFMGVEAGIKADITTRLSFMAAGSLNDYRYASDARADMYADSSLEPIVTDAAVYLSDYVCSPSPQRVLSASLRYSIPYSWSFEASFVYAGSRFVTIDPSRRMERVASIASSPEAAREFTRQEHLPDASVVNIYISKRFRLLGREMFASVAVNNLLDRKDIVYGGYEQMRVRRQGSGVNLSYSPFPSRYLYSYPRSFYATLILNF